MAAETQVHVSGKGENIHIQRDPMRGRRGYYSVGWNPRDSGRWFTRRPFDPVKDCGACKGKRFVLNDAVNKYRSHYMQYHACRVCGGSGSKTAEEMKTQEQEK